MLEKEIERKVCAYAKHRGWLVYKFTSPSRRSVPDRLLLTPRGAVIFIEFKATGKKSTVAQIREQDRLKAQGVIVLVVDSVAWGKLIIDKYQEESYD